MSYLQLAEREGEFVNYLAASPADLYVNNPTNADGTEFIKVREDYFDNLPSDEWQRIMEELADYQPSNLSGLFSNIKENIAARKVRRTERQGAREVSKMQRIEGRSEGLFGGKLKNLVSSFLPGGGAPQTDMSFDPQRGFNLDFQTQPTFMQRNKAWLIPVGIGAAALTVYLITKKKK